MTEAISTAQQSGSGMSNGIDTSNRANKCNGSDNYKGSEWARDGQQSLCSPDIDITTLSNMRRSHIKNGGGPLNEAARRASNAVITPPPSEAGSNTEEIMEDVNDLPCICDRPVSYVVCLQCWKHFLGHAVRVCPRHPRRINLMDIAVCPNTACRGSQLEERSRPPSPDGKPIPEDVEPGVSCEETTVG
uniref:Uncharacterized protein n=1 Tax=Parascaris univalens TaxID=6257 RepID=A0A915C748_PARUN